MLIKPPPQVFTGLMHHCDWAATIVAAGGGTGPLNDTALPPPDSLNLWPALLDPALLAGGPRTEVVMNVDPTNQGQVRTP